MERKRTPMLMTEIMIIQFMAGLKTQTRRTRGFELINRTPNDWKFKEVKNGLYEFESVWGDSVFIKCPYGGVGDSLLFKEKYLLPSYQKEIPKKPVPVWYCADGKPTWGLWGPVRPSMFMPIWASRHNPDITGVRACRLQEITETDAQAEGAEIKRVNIAQPGFKIGDPLESYRDVFRCIWNTINGKKYPWELNPWVWPVSFEKYEAGL